MRKRTAAGVIGALGLVVGLGVVAPRLGVLSDVSRVFTAPGDFHYVEGTEDARIKGMALADGDTLYMALWRRSDNALFANKPGWTFEVADPEDMTRVDTWILAGYEPQNTFARPDSFLFELWSLRRRTETGGRLGWKGSINVREGTFTARVEE